MLSLSFNELLPGKSVRVTADNMIYAIDMVMVVTEKNRDEAGLALRRLSEDVFLPTKMIERPTGGRGNSKTKLVTLGNALELIMVLPGRMAKETRTKMAGIIQRYLAGDATLVTELEHNAASLNPINVMARQSLVKLEDGEDPERKRRRLLLEDIEIKERLNAIEVSRSQRSDMDSARQVRNMESYKSLCTGQVMDERARLMFKDQILNAAMGYYGQKLITADGEEEVAFGSKPITVSTVASQMGIILNTAEAQKVGSLLAKMYFDKYKEAPAKHEQLVNGAMRLVNSYTERDRDLVQAAIRSLRA